MKILIIGANGFIGAYITAKLLNNNLAVICAVRDVPATQRKFPSIKIIPCDFNHEKKPEKWLNKLHDIDIVINVAGVLNSTSKNNIHHVHVDGPKALFDACVTAKIKRIIHISALGIDKEETTDYALTKKLADTYLRSLNTIDWVILQPSLVYASGCYGGTSLFRALAALPYCIPLVGDGSQQFQPIHIDDLTDMVLACVKKEGAIQKTLKLVGPDMVTVKNILICFRRWLGLSNAIIIHIPLFFIRMGAKLGDILGVGPLNSTSYKMMMQPNVASASDFNELTTMTGVFPRRFEQGLACEPLTVQSLWHARLFFLKPILKIMLGCFWIASGLITAFLAPELGFKKLEVLLVGSDFGFKKLAFFLLYGGCFVDVVLGLLLLISKKNVLIIYFLQIGLILVYTVFLSVFMPVLWLDPFGPIIKNIPIIFLTLILMAIEKDK